MAEPTSSTALAVTATAGVGIAAMLPWIDANALMGAVLGAALVAYTKKELKPWQRFAALMFSALVGYLMSGEVVAQTPLTESGTGGFLGAIIIVPLALKLMLQVDRLDLNAILAAIKRGTGG
ncbi:putative holin [Pseudomonas jilinensis]|nr:putative holin [Pseudomonas jilinensis]